MRGVQGTIRVRKLCPECRLGQNVAGLEKGVGIQSAKSRSRFEPVRLATIRAPFFITTCTRAASYGSMDVTYSRLMRWERWILKKFAPRSWPSRSDNRRLTR